MKSRMERYNTDTNTNLNLETPSSRLNRNQDLYDELYSGVKYTEIISIDNSQPYELNKTKENSATREKYQRLKEYKNLINREYKEEKIMPIVQEEPKIYDINVILDEAKKSRKEGNNDAYNNFAEVSGIFKDGESSEIKELINTITSSSLRKDIDQQIDQDLLDDLMPEDDSKTSLLDAVEVNDNIIITPEPDFEKSSIDKTFYSKSLEFNTKDFEKVNNKNEEQVETSGLSTTLKVFTVITVLLILAGLIFVIIKYIL